ncbi:Glycosyltransferase [Candidatus Magnetomoraceae bacterium gMMP-1]
MTQIAASHTQLINLVENVTIQCWEDINNLLDEISERPFQSYTDEQFRCLIKKGIAFITYAYGFDGVSIEVAKYAQTLEEIYNNKVNSLPIHFIGGEFEPKVDSVLKPCWNRHIIKGMNGWSKWDHGKWFSKLYYEDMPEGSALSDSIAKEIWQQTINFVKQLSQYLVDNDISCIIPVNTSSNPGNFAATLALCFITEGLGSYVISSNHDYYWEGGKHHSKRKPHEAKGIRDHFFRNHDNTPFYKLFARIYPWNGQRWIQVNINISQSETLTKKFGFKPKQVFELGTYVSSKFLEDFDKNNVSDIRNRMAYIFSDGQKDLKSISVNEFIKNIDSWMLNQRPAFIGYNPDIKVDLTQEHIIYCFQPTRIIGRKRIEKDIHLFQGLMDYAPFRREFDNDERFQLLLHITGPVPIEHQADLQRILKAYKKLCSSVPEDLANRVFLAFSVGNEEHPCFVKKGFKSLCIEEIYRLATVVLFPSKTEGRGLPIIESGAAGIPIICSRYYPKKAFEEVVGEHLPEDERIYYTLFPEGEFTSDFLRQASDLMLHQSKVTNIKDHNKYAIRLRYSSEAVRTQFETFFKTLQQL